MLVHNKPASVLINTPTFDTIWEDIQWASYSSTPMITEKEVAKSALFTLFIDPNASMGPLSPLLDTKISQFLNLQAAALAIKFVAICFNSSSIPPPSGQSQHLDLILRAPAMYHKLQAVDAPFWAAVSLDIQHCLSAKMSQNSVDANPQKHNSLTPTLRMSPDKWLFLWLGGQVRHIGFLTGLVTLELFHWVKVILNVPRIAHQEAPRNTMVGSTL